MKMLHITLATCALLIVTTATHARVSQQDADRLCKELTCMGANPLPSTDGVIPKYTGEILGVPKWVKYKGAGNVYPNPYPKEKPVVTITADNMPQYASRLTDGQRGLFAKYGQTFHMDVYPSKRDTRYSDFFLENIKRNALEAELAEGGNGVKNAFGAPPFPIPQDAKEVLWNHPFSPGEAATAGQISIAAVYPNGETAVEKRFVERNLRYFSPGIKREEFGNVAAEIMVTTRQPLRQKGEIILVREFTDLATNPREAWQYVPGIHRVRRAPSIAYDFPDGPGGLRTVDDVMLFNGATDFYNWTLEGKRDIYVPYNNNAADDPKLSYKTLLTPNHLNPQYVRWELHRVWVVVGDLVEGKRHIYSKRRLYLDEDTWAALLADNYDSKGKLWRTNMRTFVNRYDMSGMSARLEVYHDLYAGAYQVNNLVNEEGGMPKPPVKPWAENYFTPTTMTPITTGATSKK